MREAAIDLIGRYIVNKQQLILQYYGRAVRTQHRHGRQRSKTRGENLPGHLFHAAGFRPSAGHLFAFAAANPRRRIDQEVRLRDVFSNFGSARRTTFSKSAGAFRR